MRLCFIAVVMLSVPGLAGAQVLQPPPRSSGGLFGGGPPPDPDRVSQELTLHGSMLGGYDDNLTPPYGGDVAAPHPSGYTGFGDTTLSYRVGEGARSMEVSGRSYMNTYRNVGVGPRYGGEQRLHVRTTIGRRTHLEAAQDLGYAPYFSLGLFGVLPRDVSVENPDRNPTNALTESRSWTTSASASLVHQFTRRTSMNLGYDFSKQTYVHGAGFDGRTHAGSIGLDHSIARAVAIRATYQQSDSEFIQQDGSRLPLLTRTANLGLRYQRSLSRTRQVSFSGGAGAIGTDTLEQSTRRPVHFWGPSGSGTVRLDVGRSWSLAGDYKRSVSVLQGVAPQAFVADAGIITAGGWVQRWLETVFTAGYSNGLAGQRSSDGALGRYDGYSGTFQLRFRLTRSWASVVNLNHYQYRLNTAASQSLGVSPDMQRTAVRVGFTWSLPLFGPSIQRPEPLGGSRN